MGIDSIQGEEKFREGGVDREEERGRYKHFLLFLSKKVIHLR